MNWVDITIISMACLLAWSGWRHGILRTDFGIAGMLAGGVLGAHYYHLVADIIGPERGSWVAIISVASIVVGSLMTGLLLGSLLFRLVCLLEVRWADRFLGTFVWVTGGAGICLVLLGVLTYYLPDLTQSAVEQSRVGSIVGESLPFVL